MTLGEFFEIGRSSNMFFYVLVSLGFVTGLLLLISPKGFDLFNNALNQEYGITQRLFPGIEDKRFEQLENFGRRNSTLIGVIFCVTSFVLLLIFR